jgi:seryl-tRNA synthetase
MRNTGCRMELDGELEEIERGLDYLRAVARRFQEQCRNYMLEGKKEHERLTQEGFRLQTLLSEGQTKLQRLKTELTEANAELQNVQQNTTTEVDNYEVGCSSFSRSTA